MDQPDCSPGGHQWFVVRKRKFADFALNRLCLLRDQIQREYVPLAVPRLDSSLSVQAVPPSCSSAVRWPILRLDGSLLSPNSELFAVLSLCSMRSAEFRLRQQQQQNLSAESDVDSDGHDGASCWDYPTLKKGLDFFEHQQRSLIERAVNDAADNVSTIRVSASSAQQLQNNASIINIDTVRGAPLPLPPNISSSKNEGNDDGGDCAVNNGGTFVKRKHSERTMPSSNLNPSANPSSSSFGAFGHHHPPDGEDDDGGGVTGTIRIVPSPRAGPPLLPHYHHRQQPQHHYTNQGNNVFAASGAVGAAPPPIRAMRCSSLENALLPALDKLARTRHGAADLDTIATALKRAEQASPGLCDHLVTELITTLAYPQCTNMELRKAIDRLTTRRND
uniref:PX domain-containing protein n=1 Tax=Globodera pallida TaxID=36090 RepID=A0A183CG72_GLOPA